MSKIVSSDTLCKGTNYLQMHSIALILPMCIRSKDKLQKSADKRGICTISQAWVSLDTHKNRLGRVTIMRMHPCDADLGERRK